ncbi:MAG: VOC family protein [Gemmatimonadota bacterium]|nr:MAG: VOC family protein [Gemmatimonadota bacterium]
MPKSAVGEIMRVRSCAALFALVVLAGCSHGGTRLPPVTPAPTGEYHAGKFVWYDLLTEDVAAAKRFYGELFGWEFRDGFGEKGNYTLVSHEGRAIGGMVYVEPLETGVSRSRWVPVLSVEDVKAAAEIISRRGGRIFFGPETVGDRGVIAVVADPQGAVLALQRSVGGDPPDRQAADAEFLWTELWSRDLAGALAFYQSLVGYEHETTDVLSGNVYHLLVSEARPRAGILEVSTPDSLAHWIPYVRVSDVRRLADRVESLGGKLLIAPSEEIRGGSAALIADPTGAALAIQRWPLEE